MEQRIDLMTGLHYHITQQEITRRHELVRDFMREKGLGVLLVLLPYREGYRRWLSGVDGTERRTESCFVVPAKGEILHVTGSSMARSQEKAEKPAGAMPDPEEAFDGIRTVYCFSAFEIRDMLKESGKSRIGLIHGEEMRAQLYDYLEEFLPEVERIDVTREFAQRRAVKSSEEQILIHRAVHLQERVLEGLCGYLKPGMTEADAVRYARYLANRLGSGGIDSMEAAQVDLISWRDHQERGPLYYPGRYLEDGDMLQAGLRITGDSGFYGAITRCFSFGVPCAQNQKNWQNAVLVQEMIEDKLEPGKTVTGIQEEVKEFAKKMQISIKGDHFLHGIGYCVSEAPDELSGTEGMVLKEGMVLAAEPQVADKDGNMFCCGDVYCMTAKGAVRMTAMPRKIKILWE